MRALVKTAPGPGNLELRDLPVPRIGDNDILLQVTRAGVCGSDLHIETGKHPCSPPVVLGHEFAGVVAAVGAGVTTFAEGDRAAFRHGWSPYPGVGGDGGFAEYMRCPADCMWPTPEGISDGEASQFETVITPAALVREVVRVEPGDRVVVSGPGTIGLLAANIAKIDGASHVTVLGGPGDERQRLPIALKMGADVAEVTSPEALERLKGDAAPRCWIEASGAAAAIETAVQYVAPHGRISVSGLGDGPWNVDMARVTWDSIAIEGRWGGSGEQMPDCARLMAERRLRVDLAIVDDRETVIGRVGKKRQDVHTTDDALGARGQEIAQSLEGGAAGLGDHVAIGDEDRIALR